jgi:methylphosphotriester-DNA--protein-cysteine methyltransferase
MIFDQYLPGPLLRPYVRHFVVSENPGESTYKVLPLPGLVLGFQYNGQLSAVHESTEAPLASAGITGITNGYRIFKNAAGTGTVLVYFTETGFAHFTAQPVHELFNLSVPLEALFDRAGVMRTEAALAEATTSAQRVRIVEQFLLSQLKPVEHDGLVTEAVRLIHNSKGTMRIKALQQQLLVSQSPLEKRFRKVVGTTPKKFAALVRFHAVLRQLNTRDNSLTDLCYDNHFFDQAHFIKDFKQFTGETPDTFRRSL